MAVVALFALLLIIRVIGKCAHSFLFKRRRDHYEEVPDSETTLVEVTTAPPKEDLQSQHSSAAGGCVDDGTISGAVERAFQELERLRRDRVCKVCLSAPASMLFAPCGHLSTCTGCSVHLMRCPMCRSRIGRKIRAFM